MRIAFDSRSVSVYGGVSAVCPGRGGEDQQEPVFPEGRKGRGRKGDRGRKGNRLVLIIKGDVGEINYCVGNGE
jgi:hypothetical protein